MLEPICPTAPPEILLDQIVKFVPNAMTLDTHREGSTIQY